MQFEAGILDICLKILDDNPKFVSDADQDCSARKNPIYVTRVLSAMVGSLRPRWGSTVDENAATAINFYGFSHDGINAIYQRKYIISMPPQCGQALEKMDGRRLSLSLVYIKKNNIINPFILVLIRVAGEQDASLSWLWREVNFKVNLRPHAGQQDFTITFTISAFVASDQQ